MGKRRQFEIFINDVLKAPEILQLAGAKKYPLLSGTSPAGEELKAAYEKVISTQPRDHWLDLCAEFSVPAAPCSSMEDVQNPENTVSRHLRANGYVREEHHRDFGTITTVGQPTHYSATPNQPVEGSWHAPDVGEDTKEVL